MFTYKEQLAIVSKVRLTEGSTQRGACPFCGGKNTFTISKIRGDLVWNCYRAGCRISGSRKGTPSLESIKTSLDNLRGKVEQLGNSPSRAIGSPLAGVYRNELPTMLTGLNDRPELITWLRERNSLEAYLLKLVTVKYAPTEERIMFLVDNTSAVGRTLLNVNPRWKKYGPCESLFTCSLENGSKDIVNSDNLDHTKNNLSTSGQTSSKAIKVGVVVEDACSACAVGVIDGYTGCALLGTNLTQQHRLELLQFDRLIIALDPDATASKGSKYLNSLQGIIPCTIAQLTTDPKNYNKDELKTLLDST